MLVAGLKGNRVVVDGTAVCGDSRVERCGNNCGRRSDRSENDRDEDVTDLDVLV